MFMLTSNKTLLYPEFSDYMGTIEGAVVINVIRSSLSFNKDWRR